jgi:hypothetical protein
MIEAFVEAIDLPTLGFVGTTPATTGRPAYHEQGYVEHLRSVCLAVPTIEGVGLASEAAAATAEAMRQGLDVIAQGTFLADAWPHGCLAQGRSAEWRLALRGG